MNKIKFSHRYSKLSDKLFTTIRRYDRYKIGQFYEIELPLNEGFQALLIEKYKRKLHEISDYLLLYDTDEATRSDAIDLINSFYRTRIAPEEELTILLLLRWSD